MNLRERQDLFINEIGMFETWTDRFNYLISLSDAMIKVFPEHLRLHRFEFCQSKTCFRAWKENGQLRVEGWSNSLVIAGIIMAIVDIFDFASCETLDHETVDFHIRSGLIDNLTPMRKDSLNEMIRRIKTA